MKGNKSESLRCIKRLSLTHRSAEVLARGRQLILRQYEEPGTFADRDYMGEIVVDLHDLSKFAAALAELKIPRELWDL